MTHFNSANRCPRPANSFLVLMLLMLCAQTGQAATRYISPLGAGSKDGTSWGNALAGGSLQTAINASATGDQVWVAAGMYYTTTGSSRTVAFSMKNGVGILGSFAGTETTLGQRNLANGLGSTLSGEIGTAGIGDNSYHVISNSKLDSSAVIDGFIISGANDSRSATYTEGLGGGIFNDGGYAGGFCNPTIRNCIITNNRAVFGAGIFNSGHSGGMASPTIRNCIITNNTATDGGGGIDNFGLAGNASPALINCVVAYNTAKTAGGMYCWGGNANGKCNPSLRHCTFAFNTATAGNAGGLIADNADATGGQNSGKADVTVRNCIFWGNTATGSGPQFFVKGTGSFTATYSDINLTGQTAPSVISGAGTGNLNTDPKFVSNTDIDGADNLLFTADDGLTLTITSPCINVGDNTNAPATDIFMLPRLVGIKVDMGAYEFQKLPNGLIEILATGFAIYPNPASDWLNITSEMSGNFMLFNPQGQAINVLQTGANDVSGLAAGVYLLRNSESGQSVRFLKR